jgi:hypothetical protein
VPINGVIAGPRSIQWRPSEPATLVCVEALDKGDLKIKVPFRDKIRGNGGTVRLVFLPFEAHGYRAKETTEHVIWEKMTWFNKYVKNAGSAMALR